MNPKPFYSRQLHRSEAEHIDALRNRLATASSRFQAIAHRRGLSFTDLEHAGREAARLTAPDAFEQPGYDPELHNAAESFLRHLIKFKAAGGE